jgi:hypothetical protein
MEGSYAFRPKAPQAAHVGAIVSSALHSAWSAVRPYLALIVVQARAYRHQVDCSGGFQCAGSLSDLDVFSEFVTAFKCQP